MRRKKKLSRQALPDLALMVVTFYDLSRTTIRPMLDQGLVWTGTKIYHNPNTAPGSPEFPGMTESKFKATIHGSGLYGPKAYVRVSLVGPPAIRPHITKISNALVEDRLPRIWGLIL